MSFASLRGRSVYAAVLAAAVIGAVAAPTAAQAGHHGDAVAAGALGVIGGLAVGSAIEHDRHGGYYREREVRDCWIERRRFENSYGDIYYRRVRVCN